VSGHIPLFFKLAEKNLIPFFKGFFLFGKKPLKRKNKKKNLFPALLVVVQRRKRWSFDQNRTKQVILTKEDIIPIINLTNLISVSTLTLI